MPGLGAADYTNSFRCLSRVPNNPAPEEEGPGGALPTAISDVLGAVEEVRVLPPCLPYLRPGRFS